jgi:hypothetical protein
MANTENLKPLNTRTKKEQREIAKAGGKASGKARRKKKQLKELLELALSQPHESGEDNYYAITAALIQEALSGNTKAFEVIRDTIGQKPTDALELKTADIKINITGDTE